MKYLFPILLVALVGTTLAPVSEPVYIYVVLMWLLLVLVSWFDGSMTFSRVKDNFHHSYDIDIMAKWPLIIAYILAFYPFIMFQYEWCLLWVFVIHFYFIMHSRLNHVPNVIVSNKRCNVGLMMFSMIAPCIYLTNLRGLLK